MLTEYFLKQIINYYKLNTMRNFLLVFFLIITGNNLIAQTNSNVVFFSENGERFYLIINGLKQNNTPKTHVKVENIIAKFYKAKIVFEERFIRPIKRSIVLKDKTESTFMIKQKRNGKYVAKLQSEISIKQKTHLYSTSQTTVITNNQLNTSNQVSINLENNGGNVSLNMNTPNTNTGVSFDANNYNTTTNISHNSCNNHHGVSTTTSSTVYHLPGYNGEVGCSMPMSSHNFEDAKISIKNQDFSDSRLKVAQQIASSNCLLASQVKEIMMLFDFEHHKLEFAKFAYSKTYDKSNYFKVNDAFSFKNSTDQLTKYINRQ